MQKRFKPLRWTEWLTWAKKMEPNETFMNRVTEICPHSSKTFLTTSKSSVSDKAIFSKLYLFKTLLTDLRKTPNEIIWRKTFQTKGWTEPHPTPPLLPLTGSDLSSKWKKSTNRHVGRITGPLHTVILIIYLFIILHNVSPVWQKQLRKGRIESGEKRKPP